MTQRPPLTEGSWLRLRVLANAKTLATSFDAIVAVRGVRLDETGSYLQAAVVFRKPFVSGEPSVDIAGTRMFPVLIAPVRGTLRDVELQWSFTEEARHTDFCRDCTNHVRGVRVLPGTFDDRRPLSAQQPATAERLHSGLGRTATLFRPGSRAPRGKALVGGTADGLVWNRKATRGPRKPVSREPKAPPIRRRRAKQEDDIVDDDELELLSGPHTRRRPRRAKRPDKEDDDITQLLAAMTTSSRVSADSSCGCT